MARYMGGPRGPRARVGPRSVHRRAFNDDDTDDSNEDRGRLAPEQTRDDEIPDSDDFGSNSQVSCLPFPNALPLADKLYWKDDQGAFLRQGRPEILEGENGDGITSCDDDDYDSDTNNSPPGFVFTYPALQGNVTAQNALGNNEPRPKRQRSLSIPIHYKSRFTTGMPIFEPQPLPIAYGWMVRGTAQHVEDLHLSGIPVCNKEVHSKSKIEVLGEYTWIEVTPSQQESYERFPSIYVPGTH